MRYSRFEVLAMSFAACAVLGTGLLVVKQGNAISEVVGQALLLVALFSGLHYGRRGAAAGFLTCVAIYALVLFTTGNGSGASPAALFFLRALIFALVSFAAGELNTRFRYMFVKLEHHDFVDSLTDLYNSRYLSRLIDRYMSEFERYGSEFSLTTFTIEKELVSSMNRARRQKLIRELGNSVIRENIRGADEAARVQEEKFTILFPNTDFDSATYATVRVKEQISNYLTTKGIENGDAVSTEIMEYPRDKDEIEVLAVDLAERAPMNGF